MAFATWFFTASCHLLIDLPQSCQRNPLRVDVSQPNCLARSRTVELASILVERIKKEVTAKFGRAL